MKNLETLIQELCPDGVEFVKLGDVIQSINTGLNPRRFFSLNTPDANNFYVTIREMKNGRIVFNNDTDKINDEALKLCNNRSNLERGDVLFSGTGTIGQIVVLEENPNNWNIKEGLYALKPIQERIVSKFLAYVLRSTQIRKMFLKKALGGTVKSVPMKVLSNIEIPLPPIEVQTEIVRILDKFTSLEAELEAELDCRKRQYEYYRDKLLSFDNVGGQEVEWKKMSEVFDMRNGYTPSKAKAEYWEGGTIPWFRMEDIRENGRILSDSIQHITMVGVKKGKLFPANSFILATTATIGEHALVITDSLANQQFTNLTVRKSLSDRLLIKFVFHYMFIVDEWCKKNINVSGFASVDMNKFKKLEFPIPSLEEQHRIVSILDRFESLTTSLQSGLPAEISARRQQYEYYRDKLLTFKRKGAV